VRDNELAVLDFDLDALAGIEAGLFKPTARELEPRHEWRLITIVRKRSFNHALA
jgi:hypothetical protein